MWLPFSLPCELLSIFKTLAPLGNAFRCASVEVVALFGQYTLGIAQRYSPP